MRKVMQCMVVLPQCVCLPAGLLHCTSQTAGSQVCRTVAVVPTTAQTLFSATFAQKLSSHILPRLVPEQIPFKHSCEGPDDMPAHAKVMILSAFMFFMLFERTFSTRPAFSVPISPFPSATAELPSAPGRCSTPPIPKIPSRGCGFASTGTVRVQGRSSSPSMELSGIRSGGFLFLFSPPGFSSVDTSLITVVRYIGFIQLHPNEL